MVGLVHGGDLVGGDDGVEVVPLRCGHVSPDAYVGWPLLVGDDTPRENRSGRDEGGQIHRRRQHGRPARRNPPVVHDAAIWPNLGHNLDARICSSPRWSCLEAGCLEDAPFPGWELHVLTLKCFIVGEDLVDFLITSSCEGTEQSEEI